MHVPWAIATTGNRKQSERLLRILNLPAKIVVLTGDDVEKAKPSPDVFIAVASRLKMLIEPLRYRGRLMRTRLDTELKVLYAFSRLTELA